MKKITLLTALLFSFIGFSQSNKKTIQTYLETNRAQFGLTTQDIADLTIQNEFLGKGTKITSCYVVQRHQGIEIFNSQSNISIKDGNVMKVGSNLQSNIAQKVNTTSPSLSVIEALNKAYVSLAYSASNFSILQSADGKKFNITDGVHEDPIVAQLAYQSTSDNKLNLAWGFQFYSPDAKHYWDVKIDAVNGKVLDKKDLTISCNFGDGTNKKHDHKNDFSFERNAFNATNNSMLVVTPGTYRVIPFNYESPNHHSFDLITTAGDALASPNGWHDANTTIGGTSAALKFTYTRGNNILAQEDATGDNGNGIRADGGAGLVFDFPYVNGVSQTQQPTTYTSAATTNLFYMTNIMHDIWYQYGFDEINGNFQQSNLGRGGTVSATGDNVLADSQDGYSQTVPTLDNANFTPTNDGVRPRIQMFMWTTGAPPTDYIQINSPATIAGPMSATTNVFEGTDRIPVPAAPNGITSDLVLYTNTPVVPTQNPNSACAAATNPFEVSGHIVLIKRGGCFFSNKVKAAQDAGATAVIVTDTVPNNTVRLSMSSTGLLGITIPAVFISKEKGDILLGEMANGPVNIKLEVPSNLYLYADGDFDNLIIGHEYGHGISNRLVGGGLAGGMNNQEQMGEGWSDFFGLINQIKVGDVGTTPREVGTYVINQPVDGFGFRDFPYTTDMTLNPRTFADSNATFDALGAYKYKIGEFWASCLWDLTWAYIDKYGFDPDIYNGNGGNNKVMQLVIDALKLETSGATNIVAGRNNLFAAEQATSGGVDYCMIMEVFARRGVGMNASSGDSNLSDDQVEDFTSFPAGPNCLLAVNDFNKENMIRVYPNPSNSIVNVRVNKFVGKLAIQLIDINGRVILNQVDDNFNIEKAINISNLQSGIYIVKITGNDLNYSQKLIKN
ncbi:T9SS-dependent M36 family metallopeptidase [Flavobacterium sp.]|uniref:T9SS-dependent M36 family metallopeptidase n=1 Tax=Flavobacterium sp. TaxID=239 RepID=UPI00286CC46D|nr:T9SS-dependent M36 family metallopeptidase [Flavobacterium sp.]